MEQKFRCILCAGRQYFPVSKRLRDHDGIGVVECTNCHHIQLYPLPTKEDYAEQYKNDISNRFGKVKISLGSDFETMRVKYVEWTKAHADMYYDILQQHQHVLEIGSGYGFFAEEVGRRPDRRFSIEGVEIGEFRLAHYVGGKVHPLDFQTMPIPEEMRGKYDMILCMHLLEHLTDPISYLSKIRSLLKHGGEVLFEVPNIRCYLGELSPEYQSFMYMFEHVSYFSDKTLRFAFERAGYQIQKIYTKEIYSIENHINWVRTGKPFIHHQQMFLPDVRLEFINEEYKHQIGKMGKGYSLIIEACPL